MRAPLRTVFVAASCLGSAVTAQHGQGSDYRPQIRTASDHAEKAISKFQLPKDLRITLWAAEPDLANPVAICLDERGRVYVAESFRLHKGVTDNRSHRDWLDEELACRTVEDRVAMYRRRFGEKIGDWEKEHERVRMLEDTDGDGRADRSVVFADGFKELADGIGAGLLARRGEVFFTCIPKLWSLRDTDGDGHADQRRALHDGYGVHTSLLGHDLHGLRIGPDGKLYFSIGDRGFHVTTAAGTLSFPDEGAVFRCNLDGSGLEVVHRGLRNPQELAFDAFGNLFTGDNNSDGGDKARWVYVVEGGHSGWHIGFQSIGGRGPWNKEKLWHPHFPGQAAYVNPPICNLANGPSGLTYDPGVGLPDRYRGRFFLCEFRGGSGNSGVLAIAQQPKGAGFELTDEERLLWKVLPTDIEFGLDGAMYVADWTEGWNQPMRGRIYRLADPTHEPDPLAVAFLRGIQRLETEAVAAFLDHADQRFRQEAQFELVARSRGDQLVEIALTRARRMARIHAIWGVGQLGRSDQSLLARLLPLLDDPDHEIRAQVAKVCGWGRLSAAEGPLLERLKSDRSSRVRYFAATTLGKLGAAAAAGPLVELLRANADRDPYLRHAGVMGLVGIGDEAALARLAQDDSVSVRLAAVVALRKLRSAQVVAFLRDPAPLVVLEAARAIHDEPIPAGLPALAASLASAPGGGDLTAEALWSRVLNANFRLGDGPAIARMVAAVAGDRVPAAAKAWALESFRSWKEPSGRDRVVNLWRPLPARDAQPLVEAVGPVPHVSAAAILKACDHLSEPPKLWIVCGGGRKNAAIMADLAELVREKNGGKVIACDEAGFNGDAMEAEAWAYLAIRSNLGLPISFPSTTGCSRPVSGGRLAQASRQPARKHVI